VKHFKHVHKKQDSERVATSGGKQ